MDQTYVICSYFCELQTVKNPAQSKTPPPACYFPPDGLI
jgi:hypothetical protein